jgi:hypothetical protein
VAAYVYPGWHPIAERDASFHPGFTEWELVYSCAPRFPGHAQPRLPLWGRYDDRDPVEVGRRIALARAHGVDLFVYGVFWCRGKRVFEDALDIGFLDSSEGGQAPFAVMWANRMPRRVLPVRRADLPVIDEKRRVSSDVDDFVNLVSTLAHHYFGRKNYFCLQGKPYFSIFDSSFFVRELGVENARAAVAAARQWLRDHGYSGLHLAAIEPDRGVISHIREIGFDSVTNYVLLPYWKGPFLQDYRETAARRAAEWEAIARAARLPYFPSVSPGWDASPRGADFGPEKPRKYPWWPVVVGEHPEKFHEALARATAHARTTLEEPMVLIASLNEWSEGHTLEPDTRSGTGWLEAVAAAK